ncbi:MAG: hypothetical protein ACRDKW_13510 [Actinomycetota bacterium]
MSRPVEWWQRHTPGWPLWKWIAVALAILLVVAGLAVVGFYVMLSVAMSQWGSNK